MAAHAPWRKHSSLHVCLILATVPSYPSPIFACKHISLWILETVLLIPPMYLNCSPGFPQQLFALHGLLPQFSQGWLAESTPGSPAAFQSSNTHKLQWIPEVNKQKHFPTRPTENRSLKLPSFFLHPLFSSPKLISELKSEQRSSRSASGE